MPKIWYVVVCSRSFIGALLVTSGIAKLADVSSFADVIRGFSLLPEKATRLAALAFCLIELLVGMLLIAAIIFPETALGSTSLCAALLFLIFGSAVAINLLRGKRSISCGCFGALDNSEINWALVIRNIALCGAALMGVPRFNSHTANAQLSAYARTDAFLIGISMLLVWQLVVTYRQLQGISINKTKPFTRGTL